MARNLLFSIAMITNCVSVILGARRESVSALARGAHISRKLAHKLYHGTTTRIDFHTLDALCGYLGVDVCDLLKYVADDPGSDASEATVAKQRLDQCSLP